jgi:uncharacterized protein
VKHKWSKVLKWSRTFHIYMTLVALVTLMFFAVTGFVMNHSDWFESAPVESKETGTVPAKVLAGDSLAVVEYLRAHFQIRGEMIEDSYRAEGDAITVQFKAPSRTSEATITKADGGTEVIHTTKGLYGTVSDMHMGQHTGRIWKLVIDATAILVVTSSITGFTMWLGLRTRRKAGLIGLSLSVATVVVLFVLALR